MLGVRFRRKENLEKLEQYSILDSKRISIFNFTDNYRLFTSFVQCKYDVTEDHAKNTLLTFLR